MNGIAINDIGKLVAVLLALLGGIALAIASLIVREPAGLTAGTGMATGALGYVFGNGRLAVRNEPPSTALTPMLNEHEYVKVEDLRAYAAAQKRVGAKVAKARAGIS